jgi:Fe-Mn family superoxide dismutase
MFTLPQLPYEYDALGKYISGDIMKLHHDKHHQTYVDKLNAALAPFPELGNEPVGHLLRDLDTLPEEVRGAVRNHGGGHFNHSLFWDVMSPNGGGEPTGELKEVILAKYGTFQAFVDEFTTKSLAVFGSGWVWLQRDMEILTTPNQDSLLTQGMPAPLLGLDVWEHAYYLDYKNKRDDYVKAWWNVVNWEYVAERYKW